MIRVTDDYFIDTDERQYILKKDLHTTDKQGKKQYKILGYYSTLEYALRDGAKIVAREALANEEYSIEKALEILKEKVDEVLKNVRF